jgi:hypothetical protein
MEGSPVSLHFPRSSLNEQICSEGLLPSEDDDILKQIQAFFSTCQSRSDSQPLTTETAIIVERSWLASVLTGPAPIQVRRACAWLAPALSDSDSPRPAPATARSGLVAQSQGRLLPRSAACGADVAGERVLGRL